MGPVPWATPVVISRCARQRREVPLPFDPHRLDDDGEVEKEPGRRFKEFDCPLCSANNPLDDGFKEGDEVRCAYCGVDFQVMTSGGRLKLRER